VRSAARTGGVVTAEDHSVIGGLGGAVAEALVCHHPVPVEMVGVRDRFGTSGEPAELAAHFGVDAPAIVAAVHRLLARRS
jgi:transketolase